MKNLFSTDNFSTIDDLSNTELEFLITNDALLRLNHTFHHSNILSYLSFQISKSPEKLIFHVQRIFYCFRESLSEQLYAAILDLNIILQGRGKAVSRRLLNATKTILSDVQIRELEQYRSSQNLHDKDLLVSRYAILTKGLIGTSSLLEKKQRSQNNTYDALQLAHDYIEYSQLQEARMVLEQAILEQPDNEALHNELLQLLKSTRDKENFNTMYEILIGRENPLLHLWENSEILSVV